MHPRFSYLRGFQEGSPWVLQILRQSPETCSEQTTNGCLIINKLCGWWKIFLIGFIDGRSDGSSWC